MKTEYVAVVSAADALEGGLPWSETLVYVFAQIFGTSVERCWPISCFRFHSCHCPGTCGADPHNSSASSPQRSVVYRSEEHTSELQSRRDLVCRLLLEKKKDKENGRLPCAKSFPT